MDSLNEFLDFMPLLEGAKTETFVAETQIIEPDVYATFEEHLKAHHKLTTEALSMESFEYALVKSLRRCGKRARLSPRGTPGCDAIIEGQNFSLKTQGDQNIKLSEIHISKYMELAKGRWGSDPKDLEGLREQFIAHLDTYDRYLVLRSFRSEGWCRYELIEVPKRIFLLAKTGRVYMSAKSRTVPRSGYCPVFEGGPPPMYTLYFDGAARKLSIKGLRKILCHQHANWAVSVIEDDLRV